MSFNSLGLSNALLKAVSKQGYTTPSPIQQKAIPLILEGKDILASAQTGTGKTAGFTLPMLQKLSQGQQLRLRPIKALVLTPTRELAAQVYNNVKAYSEFLDIRSAVIFGGVNQRPQVATIRNGVDILIATPGRLIDLQNQGLLSLSKIEILVLDEADRMLDMGFYDDIMKIIQYLPKQRQNLMFAATMPNDIRKLARKVLHQPVELNIAISKPAEKILQVAYAVYETQKLPLVTHLLKGRDLKSVIVFCSTKLSAKQTRRTESTGHTFRSEPERAGRDHARFQKP
jgi:ATP-dependent RNA helicase RhlE